MSEPFGVYVHIPFCAREVRLLRVRDVDRPPSPDRRLPRRRSTTDIGRADRRRHAAGDERVRRRRHALARPGRDAGRGARGDPGRGRRRDHRRVQSRRRHRRAPHRVRRRRASTGSASGCSRWSATCSARSAARHDQRNVETAVAAVRTVGIADVQPRRDLRRGGRVARRLAHDGGVDPRPRPAARVGVRADDRGRHAARRAARPASRRRRPGRQVRARRRRRSPPPGSRTTRSRTGPAPGTSAGTTSCTGASRTTRGFGCAAHSHRAGRRWWNVRTPDRYIELVEPATCRPRRPARRSTTRPGGSRGCSWRCGCATACPIEALDGDELDGLVDRIGDRWVLTRSGRLLANAISLHLH